MTSAPSLIPHWHVVELPPRHKQTDKPRWCLAYGDRTFGRYTTTTARDILHLIADATNPAAYLANLSDAPKPSTRRARRQESV